MRQAALTGYTPGKFPRFFIFGFFFPCLTGLRRYRGAKLFDMYKLGVDFRFQSLILIKINLLKKITLI